MAACVFGETEFSLPRKEKRNRVFFNLCIENEAEVFQQKNGNRVFFLHRVFFSANPNLFAVFWSSFL